MSFYRLLLLRTLQQSIPKAPTNPFNPLYLLSSSRSFAFSSAEEAAAERRRRKRRLRIEPPLHALRRDPNAPRPPRDPNAPRLPDSTSALVGPRLNLHNRVQSLIRSGDLDSASATARQAVFSNTRPTVFTCNAIMASMYRAGRLEDAKALFRFFFQQSNIVPNIVSYNVLINTHCDAREVDTAIGVYRHVLENAPFSPSPVTYRHLTKGLVDSNRISEAMDLLREMLNKGHGADSLVYNILMDGFIKLDNMEKALELFDELRERCLVYDGVVHATLMEAYFQKKMDKEAMDSYKQLLDRQFKMSPVTCNTLLKVLLKHEKWTEALALFDHMIEAHTPPNFVGINTDTYNLLVNEYFQLKRFGEAISIFKKTGKKQCQMDVGIYNNIIGKLCAEEGWVHEAEKLFDEMPAKQVNPDLTTYNYLIDAYFREGKVDDAMRCFNKMVSPEVKTEPEVGIFSRLSAGSDVKSDLGFFNTMKLGSDAKARVKGDVCFYNKMINRLVENGRLEDAMEVLKKMAEGEVKPDAVSYQSLIMGLCKDDKLDEVRNLLVEMTRNNLLLSPELHDSVLRSLGEEEVLRLLEQKAGSVSSTDSSASAPQFQQVAV